MSSLSVLFLLRNHERPVGMNPGTYNDEMNPGIRYVHTNDGVSLADTVFGKSCRTGEKRWPHLDVAPRGTR